VTAVTALLSDKARIGFSWNEDDTGRLDAFSKASVFYDVRLAKATSIAHAAASPSVKILSGPHVIANLTRIAGNFVLHVLNYDARPADGVRVHLKLDNDRTGNLQMFTPDAVTCGLSNIDRRPGELEFTLDKLDTYAVVRIEAAR
jgi:hypothetical protein